MASPYRLFEGELNFITMTVVDWVDIFTRPEYALILIDSLEYCQKNKGLNVHAFVIMSNHVHMIISAKEGIRLSDAIRDMKKFTSKAIIKAIQEIPESRKKWMLDRFEFKGRYNYKIKDYKFWQDGNRAKSIHMQTFMLQKLNYIHQNPVKAMMVFEPEQYIFSSAANYAGQKGILEVDLLI